MATTTAPTLTTFRLIYRSHSLIAPEDRRASLAAIFTTARANNKRLGVTGALLLTDHYFVQALEGDELAVRELYERISRDPAHDDIRLVDTQVSSRVFARWAMAEVSKAGGADIPLIVDNDHGGVSTAAARPTTRERDAVLGMMRNVIGADTL